MASSAPLVDAVAGQRVSDDCHHGPEVR
jgi:hypothetical protein